MSTNRLFLLGFMLTTALTGCVESPVGGSQAKNSDESQGAGGGAGKVPVFKIIDEKTVDTNSLNTIEYKVAKLGINSLAGVSFRMYMPIISVTAPKGADYVEIMRCSALYGIVTELKKYSLNSQPSDVWTRAKKTCEIVTENGVQQNIIDYRAKKGDYYYVARACVRPERLKKSGSACSDLVTITPGNAYSFEDRLAARVDAMREEIARSRDAIAAINFRITASAVAINNAYARCELRDDQKKKLLNKHNKLMEFLKFGTSAAQTLLGDGLSNFNPAKFLDVAKDAATLYAKPETSKLLNMALGIAQDGVNGNLPFMQKVEEGKQEAADAPPSELTETDVGGATQQYDNINTGSGGIGLTAFNAFQGPMPEEPATTEPATEEADEPTPQASPEPTATKPPVVDTVLQNFQWDGLRGALEGMMATPEETILQNQCAGVTEINDKLRADKAQLIANKIALDLMEEGLSNAKAVKDAMSAKGGQ